ncbi:MAG: AfsR/SARP family transcriptional regulator [Egibacteraceae bacterium]
MTAEGRYSQAIDAGLAAIAGEPLRESAHRALIRAYLAEGNPSEALRQYRIYRRLLHDPTRPPPSRWRRSSATARVAAERTVNGYSEIPD